MQTPKDWDLTFVIKMIFSQRYLFPEVWDVNIYGSGELLQRDDFAHLFVQVFKIRKTILVSSEVPQSVTEFHVIGMTDS